MQIDIDFSQCHVSAFGGTTGIAQAATSHGGALDRVAPVPGRAGGP
ncbi:hypothetical protein [Pseudorhodoferax sp.]